MGLKSITDHGHYEVCTGGEHFGRLCGSAMGHTTSSAAKQTTAKGQKVHWVWDDGGTPAMDWSFLLFNCWLYGQSQFVCGSVPMSGDGNMMHLNRELTQHPSFKGPHPIMTWLTLILLPFVVYVNLSIFTVFKGMGLGKSPRAFFVWDDCFE